MMILLFCVVFLAGFVFSRIIFGGIESTNFEKSIISNLDAGKRVVVCFNNDAYIFEKFENRYRITRGSVDFLGEDYGLDVADLAIVDTPKLDDIGKDDSDGSSGTGLH